MKASAKSLLYFGIYLLLTGITLLTMPNLLLSLFGLPGTTEVWIRVVGMLALMLGAYYIFAAQKNLVPFFQMTVYVRGSAMLFFGAFVAMGMVKPALLLFGVVDLLGAAWTHLALKKENHPELQAK